MVLLLHELNAEWSIFQAYFSHILTLHCLLVMDYQKCFCLILAVMALLYHLNKRQLVGSKFNFLEAAQLKIVFYLFQDVAAHCDVKCMPTFQFYKNGKKVGSALLELEQAN